MTSNPTTTEVEAVARDELAERINRTLRSFEFNGGNILDALATYHNEPTVKEALETLGDWSVWLAAEVRAAPPSPAITLLRTLEWSGDQRDGFARCPTCGNKRDDGHRAGCGFIAALGEGS